MFHDLFWIDKKQSVKSLKEFSNEHEHVFIHSANGVIEKRHFHFWNGKCREKKMLSKTRMALKNKDTGGKKGKQDVNSH